MIIILTYVLAQFATVLPYYLTKIIDINNLPYVTVIWNIVVFGIAVIISLLLLKSEIRDFFQAREKGIGQIILWSILGFFLVMIAQGVSSVIERFIIGVDTASENTLVLMQVAREIPVFLIIITILGPILEELVFRKAIFGSLYKRMNFFFSAIISGVLFAVLHMDFSHLLTYIAAATVFAFLYVETKKIIVPIIVHMSMNTMAVIAQLSLDPEQVEQLMEQLQLILLGGY
jgi:uncharacterized protein